jgi:hypothetical protein
LVAKRIAETSSPTSTSTSPGKLLPHIGLIQACSINRSEFRPIWLSTHNIPLSALDTYFKAFYPRIDRTNAPSTKQLLKSQTSASGSLRVWIRSSELDDIDIIKLLKHAIRFRKSTISIHSLPNVDAAMLSSIEVLVSNKTDRWVSGIQDHKISRVLLYARFNIRICKIAVKEKFALPWMKPYLGGCNPVTKEYLESLGLDAVAKVWQVRFGVDYS